MNGFFFWRRLLRLGQDIFDCFCFLLQDGYDGWWTMMTMKEPKKFWCESG